MGRLVATALLHLHLLIVGELSEVVQDFGLNIRRRILGCPGALGAGSSRASNTSILLWKGVL
jgi:hypothetical protein